MNNSAEATTTILTAGEILPDGELIERLSDNRLLFWSPEQDQRLIASGIEWGGKLFQPAPLDPSLQQVLRFPSGVEPFGTAEDLIRDLALEFAGDEAASLLLAGFADATWLTPWLPAPPLLNLWGSPGTENRVVSVLSCLCRCALPIALPALGDLFSLPRGLDPTLILRVKRDRDLASILAATAHSGAGSLKKGRLLQVRCPMIVCTPAPLAGAALSIPLLPMASCRPIGRAAADQLASRFLPRFLDFRLRRHQQVAVSDFDVAEFASETKMVAMTLGSVLEGERKLQARLVEALRPADEGWKAMHAQADDAIVLEVLLVACHEDRLKIYVGELTELANALLLARQAKKQLSHEGIGRMLHDEFRLFEKRDTTGNAVMLDRPQRERIHQLSQSRHTFSSLQPMQGCLQCRPASLPEAAGPEPETLHNLHSLYDGHDEAALPPASEAADTTAAQAGGAA